MTTTRGSLSTLLKPLLQLQGVLPGDSLPNIVRAWGPPPVDVGARYARRRRALASRRRYAQRVFDSSGGLLALRIVEAERAHGDSACRPRRLIAFAQRCAGFIELLRDSRGLIADHIRRDGRIEPSVYSCNQGTALGLSLQLHRITHDEVSLRSAHAGAVASVEYYPTMTDCGVRVQPSSRSTCATSRRCDTHNGDDVGAALEADWLNRLTVDARNSRTGFYTRGGWATTTAVSASTKQGLLRRGSPRCGPGLGPLC